MQSRGQRESAFHNQRYSHNNGVRKGVGRYYSITRNSRAFYLSFIETNGANKNVLEYGCGRGSDAFFLASKGATITGIDISPIAIELATQQARREQTKAVTFQVMNAEALEFDSDTFDLVCGTGIIHHLALHKAYAEIARTLKPEGAAIIAEPLGHNPLINLFRKLTPDIRSEDEHPLLMQDLKLAEQYFATVETHFFHLLTLLAVPFRKLPGFNILLAALAALESGLFKLLPFTRRFAWQVIIVLSQPRKNSIR